MQKIMPQAADIKLKIEDLYEVTRYHLVGPGGVIKKVSSPVFIN